MSTYGFPDGQEITQWLGQPLEEATALAIGAGSHVAGPFSLANFASVIVAVKPTGGQVTVKVSQGISGGPASLVLEESVVVAAGATLFEAFVLFGDAVTIEFDGAAPGETIDYAIYPSNTTTNAQVITQATINVQHNDVLVGAEPTLDFEDVLGFPWTISDDGANTRVKITPPIPGLVKLAETTLGAATTAIDFSSIPATYTHLLLVLSLLSDQAAAENVNIALNGDTTNANYTRATGFTSGTAVAASQAQDRLCGLITSPTTAPGVGPSLLLVPNYRQAQPKGFMTPMAVVRSGPTASVFQFGGGTWLNNAAVNEVTLTPTVGKFNPLSYAGLFAIP